MEVCDLAPCAQKHLSLYLLFACIGRNDANIVAHAVLMESTPKANSTVKGPDVPITLRFNSRIDGDGRACTFLLPTDPK